MSAKMTDEEIEAALPGIPGWEVRGDRLFREFKFKNFRQAFAFMTAAALSAEKMDHHPDWSNSYNVVEISLQTHSVGGVTEKDFELAAVMNAAAG